MPFHNEDICGMVQALQLQEYSPTTYIPVPLTSVHLDVRVVNFIAQVEVQQEFVNKEAGPIECIYFFPVEEEAAVIDFTAELEGKIIKTEVKEKEEARNEYKAAVQERQTAFLLEETKPDIFEIKVGHLSPGAGCKICITYLCELPVEEGMTRLTIPTTVAPRYTPPTDTSEEARKISTIQHDFKSPVKMTMKMEIVMKSEIIQVKSPSHPLTDPPKVKHGEYSNARLDFDGNTTDMDRDLVVLIDTEEPNIPKIIVEKNESGSEVAMLSFVPQFKLKEHQVEAVFLVDCSGSMAGRSMDLAKEALQVFLHSLPVTSCFNIILFGNTFMSMFSESKTYDDDTLKNAKMFVQNISANLGGTAIYQPLEHIFNLKFQIVNGSKIPRQVFVITDGQVSNSTACINLVKKNSRTNRVFTLGIGASADRHLVKGMARAGRGTAAFTTEGEPITSKVISQMKNALQPCISDVKVKWDKEGEFSGLSENNDKEVETERTLLGFGKPKKNTLPQEEVNDLCLTNQTPRNIPAIYDGSRLLVYKLINKTLKMEDMITVKAATPEGELELSVAINLDSFIEGDAVHKLFARKKIQEMEESSEQEETSEKKKFITELGLKYKLASKYTSFVGVDAKINKQSGFMMTRHIKNQIPHNSTTPTYGGFGAGHSVHAVAGAAAPVYGGFGATQPFHAVAGASAPVYRGFGAAQPAPAFGFGAAQKTGFGGFGTATSQPNQIMGLFGNQQEKPGFGGFGAQQASSSPAFGGFGGTNYTAQSGGLFGASAAPAFGGFGATATSQPSTGFGGFGQNTGGGPFGGVENRAEPDFCFGATSTSPTAGFGGFGGTNTASGELFGGQNKPEGFGGGNCFGTTSTSGFGPTTGFGAASSGFGASAPNPAQYMEPCNKVLSLISCQEANGSFISGIKMAAALGVSLDLLLTEGRKVLCDVSEADQEALLSAWTTVVVLNFLREQSKKDKEVCELVVEKAERWLHKYATNFTEAHMKKANEFVTLYMSPN